MASLEKKKGGKIFPPNWNNRPYARSYDKLRKNCVKNYAAFFKQHIEIAHISIVYFHNTTYTYNFFFFENFHLFSTFSPKQKKIHRTILSRNTLENHDSGKKVITHRKVSHGYNGRNKVKSGYFTLHSMWWLLFRIDNLNSALLTNYNQIRNGWSIRFRQHCKFYIFLLKI